MTLHGPKTIAFDLDGVLCSRNEEKDSEYDDPIERYRHCYPIRENIDIVNELYNRGHYIKIFTARGMTVFKGDIHKVYQNLYPLTLQCLEDWGVKFHELIMGKAHYDILFDDKAIHSRTLETADWVEKDIKKNETLMHCTRQRWEQEISE